MRTIGKTLLLAPMLALALSACKKTEDNAAAPAGGTPPAGTQPGMPAPPPPPPATSAPGTTPAPAPGGGTTQ